MNFTNEYKDVAKTHTWDNGEESIDNWDNKYIDYNCLKCECEAIMTQSKSDKEWKYIIQYFENNEYHDWENTCDEFIMRQIIR
jgi:hypothetical protein